MGGHHRSGSRGGGGSQNEGEKTLCACSSMQRVVLVNSYPDPPTPFPKSCIHPCTKRSNTISWIRSCATKMRQMDPAYPNRSQSNQPNIVCDVYSYLPILQVTHSVKVPPLLRAFSGFERDRFLCIVCVHIPGAQVSPKPPQSMASLPEADDFGEIEFPE